MQIKPTPSVIDAALADLRACLGDDASQRWLLVDTHLQQLWLMLENTPQDNWPVSTAVVGLDNRQDSGGTPPGVHRIAQKIGQEAALGTVFESRVATGVVWQSGLLGQPGQPNADDLILTRILTLTGCESGLNLGGAVDSLARYIYLHGTNHEAMIGQPVSHGCVRLTNPDICRLFECVAEGDPVVIA